MKSVVLVALCLVAVSSAFSVEEYRTAFTDWMIEHKRTYSSEDFQTRFEIFSQNMDYVEEWNSKNSTTVLGLNNMADLSNSEYRNIYLGTRIDASAALAAAAKNPLLGKTLSAPLADTVDWRTQGAVTPIKDQGQCGSCWSFSTTGSTEGAWFLAKKQLVSLSEQNLMDCSYLQGNLACNGGLMTNAFKWIINNKGIATEASYPYTAKTSLSCHFSTATKGAEITSYNVVAAGKEDELAKAVNQQPISVAIDASHNSFQLYKSGVYLETACSSSTLDHGVLVVGYGTTGTTDYWTVKNSWGTAWGTAGYIQMSRNHNNNCGIATQASYPTV